MPMNPNFLCCIGAELKNSTQQTTRMSQVYFYRAFEEETVADMLQPGFFDAAMGIVRKDDLLLLYDPKDESARWTYCRVSNVDRSGVEISLMGVNAKDVLVEISGEDPITLQSLIDNTIMPAIENIGDMDLPVITAGGTAPTNLSEAIRQIVTQDLTLTEDSVEPESGQFSLWGAIKKALENAKNFFSSISNLDTRLNALEGQGGPVGSYDFGKSFPNILDATDTQLVAGVMVDNIWAGHTPIVWTTPIANSTFTDGDGVDRTVGEIFNGTWIINSYDGTRIVLTNTPNTTPPIFSYQNVGVYSVGFANATTAGVVRVGTGSDMTVDQATGDISIDDTKGYSIFHRLISLFTGTQKTQIRSDLNAASRDMDDLSATGQNIGNWSSNVTNCIIKIPQDIKIEINASGQLVVKAGSKAYVPNGVGTFTEVTVATDQVWTADSYNHDEVFFIKLDGTLARQNTDMLSSGATNVMGDTPTYCHCYNTTDNKIYYTQNGGSTWAATNESFPIALVTKNNSKFVKIKQVFNGFGYMGSTVFVLPGVKVLAPNGKNSDGTLKNTEFTATSVLTNTRTWNATIGQSFVFGSNNVTWIANNYYISETMPSNNSYSLWYKPSENIMYLNRTSNEYTGIYEWEKTDRVFITNVGTGTAINETYFNPQKVFAIVDYNDTKYIAQQAMPSDRYMDLTLPASGGEIIAPADGYIYLGKNSSAAGQRIKIAKGTLLCTATWSSGSNNLEVYLPVSKGDVISFWYTAGGTTNVFRFVYANGAK